MRPWIRTLLGLALFTFTDCSSSPPRNPGETRICYWSDGTACRASSVVCTGGVCPPCSGGELSSDGDHCGAGTDSACGSCSVPNGTSSSCASGQCTPYTCLDGYFKCAMGCCRVTAVAPGLAHTCALTNLGGVKCWGYNLYGQLGNNSTADSLVPVDVCAAPGSQPGTCAGLLSGAVAIASGDDHVCVVTSTGGVKCWGYNNYGQLGYPTTGGSSTVPMDVPGLSGVTAITAGDLHTCALTGGGVKCWGYNVYGQLGNNTTVGSTAPVDVCSTGGCSTTLSGVAAIAAGGDGETCALMSGGGVKCWGYNVYGQLGNGSTTNSPLPIDVCAPSDSGGCTAALSGVSAIAVGRLHACALVSGGVECWGYGRYGQLGNNKWSSGSDTAANSSRPVDVCASSVNAGTCQTVLSGVASIGPGGHVHTCALMSGGGIRCWGNDSAGQIGNANVNTTTPVTIPADVCATSTSPGTCATLLSGATAVAAAYYHTCAVMSSGGAACWGNNDKGQIGNDTSGANVSLPVEVAF